LSNSPDHEATARQPSSLLNMPFPQQPAVQLIYDTAPIGLAFLSPDCRYLQINQRLTEISGISVEDHLGRSVRECVPALAESVENKRCTGLLASRGRCVTEGGQTPPGAPGAG
jgi:PAS domain-containing protein